ncbi:DUF4105 domain-containing protein [Botrimarina sp.]|uniref:Lnb N-terminal periplasmic domain-containing protein n=1 Tax=Botrimarina sp. TaxID=2795802 RepID=UPI0032F06F1C
MDVRHALIALSCCGAALGCRTVEERAVASNHRDWAPDQAVLPRAKFNCDRVRVENVRYCKHLGPGEYVVDYDDRSYELSRVRGVDFITMPFGPVPALAHTMVSFEFAPRPPLTEPEHLAVSVEVRKEKGEETFNPALGLAQQYEIMYVVADERDVLYRQAVAYDSPVYLYRTTATPEAARELLVSMLQRANELADEPEFYHLLTNNCTTNIYEHVNLIRPNRLLFDAGVLLPGLSAEKAYKEGLLVANGESFQQLQARSLINTKARLAANDPGLDFSEAIRR